METPQFFWIQPTDLSEPPRFVNLAQIAMVTFERGHLVLHLNGGVAVNLGGPGKNELGMFIINKSLMLNGEKPPQELLDQLAARLRDGA